MLHFLLTYSLTQGRLVDIQTFRSGRTASRAYVQAERRNGRNDDFEIVLVGADSLETLRTTHGHYFDDTGVPMSPYLAGV